MPAAATAVPGMNTTLSDEDQPVLNAVRVVMTGQSASLALIRCRVHHGGVTRRELHRNGVVGGRCRALSFPKVFIDVGPLRYGSIDA
jgi:hypothetical protein